MNEPRSLSKRPTSAKRILGLPSGWWFAVVAVALLAVALIVASTLIPSVGRINKRVQESKAETLIAELVRAIERYHLEYGRYPVDTSTVDLTVESNGRFLAALSGDLSERSSGGWNPDGSVFFPVTRFEGKTVDKSSQVDYWGNLYRIRIDADGNGRIEDPETQSPREGSILIWSAGPDKKEETWDDNLKSWND